MANEFRHKVVGTELSQAEYEDVGSHEVQGQATGDIIYASSTTQFSRLAIVANRLLGVVSGLPAWVVSALTRAGGNTTEGTTTSTVRVTLLSITVTSIAAENPYLLLFRYRKTTGAANSVSVGAGFNAVDNGSTTPFVSSDTANQAGAGIAELLSYTVGGLDTDGGAKMVSEWVNSATGTRTVYRPNNGSAHNVAVTTVLATGLVADALITLGADDAQVYMYAVA